MVKLIVNVGGMFSGKTTSLIQQGERYLFAKKKVAYIKPDIDDRYSEDYITTHKGQVVKAMVMPTQALTIELLDYDVVLIDEVQFFEKHICEDVKALLENNITVIVAGLDMDFQGEGFETVMKLMSMADEVLKHKAVCDECGEDATFSFRKVKSTKKVLLGEKESYVPLCRKCYYKKMYS